MTFIFLTSILILLHIPISFTKTKNFNFKDHSSDPLSNNCKDQFELSYKIQDIKSLNVPNLETEDDHHYAFVTTNPFGCLETGYFMVEGNSKLEIPYFLSKCKPGKFKLQLVLKDLLGNFMMKTLQPGKLNHWNVFSMNLPKNDNECVPYKVLIRSYTKNCTVIIKHVHIRPIISKQHDSKANETTLVRQKREGGDSEEQHDIKARSKEAITLNSISATEGVTAPTTEHFCGDRSVSSSTERAYDEEIDSRILKQLVRDFIPQIDTKVPKPTRKQSTAFSSETHSTEAAVMKNPIPDSTEIILAERSLLGNSVEVEKPNSKEEVELKLILRPKSADEPISATQNSAAESSTTKSIKKLDPQNRTKSVTVNPVAISDHFINKAVTLLKKTLKSFIVDEPTSMVKSLSLALILAGIIIIVIVFFVYLACLALLRRKKCSKCK